MIEVTKMGGEKITLNADLIEQVKATPDTVITLTTEKRIIVEEDKDEVVKRVMRYQQRVHNPPGKFKE